MNNVLQFEDDNQSLFIVQGFGTAVCIVASRMMSTNATCLFGRVGEFNVARETFGAYVERVKVLFKANNIVEATKQGCAAANQVVGNRNRAINFT